MKTKKVTAKSGSKKPAKITQSESPLNRRFKILYLLTSELKVMDEQMDMLARAIDGKDPQAEEALTFYENQVISILEA